MGMPGIPDLDRYGKQYPSAVNFEPWTLNLKPISLGTNIIPIADSINPFHMVGGFSSYRSG